MTTTTIDTHGALLRGVEAQLLPMQVRARTLPGVDLQGAPKVTRALTETCARVRCGLASCNVLTGASVSFAGSTAPGMDLPIAAAILAASGKVPTLEGVMFWGEIDLDGRLRPTTGTVAVALAARDAGMHTLIVAEANAAIAAAVPDIIVIGVRDLCEMIDHLRSKILIPPSTVYTPIIEDLDWDVVGLAQGCRAVEIAVAGHHHMLMVGPPGVGKTMLARRAASCFPQLSTEAALDSLRIFDATGCRHSHTGFAPCRVPHHNVSHAGLFGGGRPLRAGEVTLATHGMLFLDELPEFNRSCLEGLPESLKTGQHTIVHSDSSIDLPARFLLLAGMHPCPCGYKGHPRNVCRCSPEICARYNARVASLLPHFDLHVALHPEPVTPSRPRNDRTSVVRERVIVARQRQLERLSGTGWTLNGEVTEGEHVNLLLPMVAGAHQLLRQQPPGSQLCLQRVARTIADLDNKLLIEEGHVNEALSLHQPQTKGQPSSPQ